MNDDENKDATYLGIVPNVYNNNNGMFSNQQNQRLINLLNIINSTWIPLDYRYTGSGIPEYNYLLERIENAQNCWDYSGNLPFADGWLIRYFNKKDINNYLTSSDYRRNNYTVNNIPNNNLPIGTAIIFDSISNDS